jgi:uncharacterized protein DUF4349
MKSRNGNPSDAVVERELAVVDAALADRPVQADHAELAELVRAVRAERPRPRPGFTEALDAQHRQGFRATYARGPSAEKRRRLAPLTAGAAAAILIAVTAVISSGVLSDEPRQTTADRATPEVVQTGSPSSAGGSAPAAPTAKAPAEADQRRLSNAAPLPRSRGVLPHVRNRQVERDAALTLATPSSKIEDTADGVIEVTDRYQGFVLRSNVSSGDRSGTAGATLELRIPTTRLQPALRDLSALAHVRSRTQSSQDITARFVSARSRLRDAVTERRVLLGQLARAGTLNETASIRARLRLATRQIAAVRSDLRGLRNRVDFSTVAVTIEADENASSPNSGWTPGDALDDALGVLGVAAGVALVSLAVVVPVALVGLLALLAYRRVQRERRDRALDF